MQCLLRSKLRRGILLLLPIPLTKASHKTSPDARNGEIVILIGAANSQSREAWIEVG